MAADTREDSANSDHPSQNVSTQSITRNNYERFNDPVTRKNEISLPAKVGNTAEGNTNSPGFLDALASVKLKDFKDIHRLPCARDSLVTGMSAGFVAGGLRAIRGGPIFNACSWAVGTFCFGSWAAYEFCNRKRLLEMQAVKRAVEVIDYKKAERQKRTEKATLSGSQHQGKGSSEDSSS